MRGGSGDGPCMNPRELAAFEQSAGRPCPFVELQPGNTGAAEVIPFLTIESLRVPFALEAWRDVSAHLPRDERRLLRLRIKSAITEKRVVEALYPWTKEKPGRKGKA